VCLEPALALNPAAGPVGTPIVASATGFESGEVVSFTFWSSALPPQTCVADATGACSVSITAPPSPLPAQGYYSAMATGGTSNLWRRSNFYQNPSISMNPTSAFATDTVTAGVNGFLANETVQIFFNPVLSSNGFTFTTTPQVASCTADQNGSCAASFAVPAGPRGSYPIYGFGDYSNTFAQTAFQDLGPILVPVPIGL
jgi:hypothetical protein